MCLEIMKKRKEATKLTCDFPDYENDKYPAIDFPIFALSFQ